MAGLLLKQRKAGIERDEAEKSTSNKRTKGEGKLNTVVNRKENDDSKRMSEDFDEIEEVLRQFDLNSKYGPCMGMTRYERWCRAESLGLDPPNQIIELLRAMDAIATGDDSLDTKSNDNKETSTPPKYVHCLWEGRV